jgi:hypothetical protein
MPDSMKKLREPAALATVAFVGLGLIGLLIGLLSPDGDGGFGSFSDRSYTASGLFLSFDFAIALTIAVYLANHAAGGPLAKARLITLAALVEAAVAIVFGVITMLAAFGADGVGGSAKFGNFLGGLGTLAVLAVAAWYVWLTWQQHAPAKAPVAQAPAWSGGYPVQQQYGQPPQPQPGQYPGQQAGQYPGQPQPQGQPQAPGQQNPPPGGFGWTPQQQAGQAADRTQLLPPVPGGPAGFAASPQPWNPAAPQPGPGQNPGQNQGRPQQPGQPGEQPQQPSGPFSVGDWRSDS